MFNIDQKNLKNANLFAAGLALGTVGLKVLTSKDAKKVYAGIVAAGLRAKETGVRKWKISQKHHPINA